MAMVLPLIAQGMPISPDIHCQSIFPPLIPTKQIKGVRMLFVSKLDSTGSALIYSTYLGGSGSDIGYAIAVDSTGNAYIMGYTDSNQFPNP